MNMKKRVLSFLLAVAMVLTMVPALSVSAAEPVDLIHSSGTNLREGVFVTSFGGQYNANLSAWRVIDNSTAHAWASAWSPGGYAWVQINMPAASQWTNVTITATDTSNYNVAFDVLASNDPTFATSTLLTQKAGGYTGADARKVVIDDATLLSTPFRYLRVITTSSGKRFGVSEIDITGYEPTLPATDGLTDLTKKADVYAKASTDTPDAYKAQQAIDGDSETSYTVTGATSPELMVDLRREVALKMIEFTPAAGDDTFRKDYEIHTSNSPDFANYNVVYKNIYWATAEGAAVKAYLPDGTSARYVRIKADGASLGVKEFNVWGTEGVYTLENMALPIGVLATSGANPENTTDNAVSTVWSSAEEATKAAITYDIDGAMALQEKALLPVTSIMLMPEGSEESRKNFNIYGSVLGDFSDAELIASVGETPIAAGAYEIITLEEPKAYKKVKIEKATEPCIAGSLAFREVKIIHNSLDAVVKVEATSPANGATGVTNFGNNPDALTNLIEIELNRNIIASSINPANVIIKDITDGADITLTDWKPYEISGKKATIDLANLSSDKTYEVTLTTNVLTTVGPIPEEYKFTFTTGSIIAVPYDPDKVLVNVVTGKNISGNGHSSYPLDRILDGNDSNFMITSGAPKIQLDLGNIYDIVAVQVVPRAGDPDNTIPNVNILADVTAFNFAATDIMDKAVATYPAKNEGTKTFVLDTPAHARYLGIYRTSTYLGLGEFRAYAYVDKDALDFGAWKVNGSAATTEFSAAGDFEFSISVNNMSADTKNLYMTAFAYDEEGELVAKSNEVKAVASGKNTLSTAVTLDAAGFEKATRITAMLTNSQNDARMVVDAKTITKKDATLTGPTPDATNAIRFEYTALSDNERVAVQILGPNGSGAGYDFDEVSEVTFNTELCYAAGSGMLKKGEKVTFGFKVFDLSDYGEYSARMVVTKADGTKSTFKNYLLYLSQANIDECVNDFKAFPATLTMEKLLDKWTDKLSSGRKYIRTEELPAALKTSVPAKFGDMFEHLCGIYEADGKMSGVSDVIDCLNAAYIMSMYEADDAEAVKSALKNYSGDINGLYDRVFTKDEEGKTVITEIVDAARYATVYAGLKGNITDAASMKEVMEWSHPLALIQNGTRRDVTKALTDYAEVLGYDASYATDKNVTLEQVAMKIETAQAALYYNAFAKVFEDAVDAVVAGGGADDNTDTGNSVPSVSSPGVGGMSTKPVKGDKENVKDDKEEKPVTPPAEAPAEKAVFADVEGLDWAKDHINALYKKGVINGDGTGKFNPNNKVTREEFLKMLVEALDIDAAAKETSDFEDCEKDAWYYPYVLIASTNKITKGISRKVFGIGQNITRQDMAVLLSKALAVKNVISVESDEVFGDVDAISEYAQSDVSKMYNLGIISGMGDGTFAPKEFTTRAQAAVIISRALEILGGASK